MKRLLLTLRQIEDFLRAWLGHVSIAYAVLAVALVLTGLAYLYVRHNVEQAERARFAGITASTAGAMDRRMDTYVDAMLDGRGLFAASELVTREEWRAYVAAGDLVGRYPGIQAVAYARRVPLEDRESHLRGVRDEGLVRYDVRPSGERYEYFPLTYVEPYEGRNRSLLGRDFYADRINRDAMEQARDTGLPRASGKADLGEVGIAGEAGFLVYTPVYGSGEPHGNTDERREALQGFIVSVFRADELFEGIFGGPVHPRVGFEVYDGAETGRQSLLYNNDDSLHAGNPPYRARFHDFATLEVAGRIWTLYFSTLPGFGIGWERNLPLLVLASGLAISFMLFGVTWMLARSRVRAERVGLDLEAANRNFARANRDLESANRDLKVSNSELEAFSYSVSHDLRSPLRSIEGFSQILLEDHAAGMDKEARSHLGRVRAASRRMAGLIDDLLHLSRVTRAALERSTVDLSTIAGEVVAELRRRDPKRRVEFVVSPGLRVNGDARLLRLALENLLGNAWKFTSRRQEARIELGDVFRGGTRAFFVKDNGVGFDEAYSGKLFGAFQRLHGTDEFEGTGIGLATVARIVRRHGGEVWAEGQVGKGATFFFTLPG